VVTKKGKPMAVIVPYEKYLRTRKVEGRRKILESRTAFAKAGVSADTVYRESKKELNRLFNKLQVYLDRYDDQNG